jgi:hypothetical protein
MPDKRKDAAEWSDELDALRFSVPGHGAPCAMHRLAFKALLAAEPLKEACLAFFAANEQAFFTAAATKITRLSLPADRSLHINSRDLRRAMTADHADRPLRACRVLDRRP